MLPKTKGSISELKFMARAIELGYFIFQDLTDNSPIDCLLTKDCKNFLRVQIKTAILKKEVLVFRCCSSASNMKGSYRKNYIGKIDYYGVYSPKLDTYYLVPVQENTNSMQMRLLPTKNGQIKKVKLASDFEFKQ